MADPTPPPPPAQQQPPAAQPAVLQIPEEAQKKYPELIELIKRSESMNDEERQYWINILPVMTPDQVKNLYDILENERKQLAAIDAKYQTEIDKIGQAELARQTEEQRKKQRLERTGKESVHKQEEDKATEDILKQIEEAGTAGKS